MKKVILSLTLALILLLGISPAHATDQTSKPFIRDDVACPIQLFCHNPQTGLAEEVDFIEPDFETPPENYLYEICNRYTYEIRFQLPPTIKLSNAFKVDYSSSVTNGDLGTIIVEYVDLVKTPEETTQTIYHGELKFVATGDLELQHTDVQIDMNNQLTLKFSTNTTSSDPGTTPSSTTALVHVTRSNTSQDLYTTDLSRYLYPSTFAAFRSEGWNALDMHYQRLLQICSKK